MPIVLGYWKIRGLAQPIRLLLKYTGTDFEDVRYEQGAGSQLAVVKEMRSLQETTSLFTAPGYSREVWTLVKDTIGLDFPNLPYLIDGDLKITQSNAILRYVAEKNNLCGSTLAERAVIAMLEGEAMDFRNRFVYLCYNSDFANMVDNYKTSVKGKLQRFSDYLGQKQWFTGDQITFVDFLFYELFDQHRVFDASLLDGCDNIKAFLARFEALPAIKAYKNSPDFIAWPVNNLNAKWSGGSGSQ